jgi:hypothetical protein
MRNQNAILKRLEKIESAISGIANPRSVVRVIGDEPAPEDNDSVLIIRRVLVAPKPVGCETDHVPSLENQGFHSFWLTIG